MIKSPYYFVPAGKKVFAPDTLGEPSIDVPFSDSISGHIELRITAKSPVFIRNGHTKEDADNNTEEYQSFSKSPDGKYFIPSSSIRGCIRNIVGIVSSGKMRVDKRAAFAQRDFNDKELYPLKNIKEQARIHCGWLRADGTDAFTIADCGIPYRVSLKDIDDWLGTDILKKHFSKESRFDLNKEQVINGKSIDPKTAECKYRLLSMFSDQLHDIRFSSSNDEGRRKVWFDPSGSIKGDIVFTGQPGPATDWGHRVKSSKGKYYEFVFPSIAPDKQQIYKISEDVMENYLFIYSDSPDWKFHSADLHSKGIPVFFRLDGNHNILDFGLAYMYRLPYSKTPYEIEEERLVEGKGLDMATRLFGYTSPLKSLRGRVAFSNFFSDNAEPDKSYQCVLGNPKASYYPYYIHQEDSNGKVSTYRTYNDGELSGWKLYLRRKDICPKGTGNSSLDTAITPLKAGSVFKGSVSFHNLRPEELGALLSALTFHGNPDFEHMIGQGKPYGFGRISIELLSDGSFRDIQGNEITCTEALEKFEILMENYGFSMDSPSCRELFSISGTLVNNEDRFGYLNLGIDTRNNEFAEVKKDHECLPLFSELMPSPDIASRLKAISDRNARRAKEKSVAVAKAEMDRLETGVKEAESHLEDLKKAEQENLAKEQVNRYAGQLSEKIQNVSSLGNLAGTIKKWMQINNAEFGEEEIRCTVDKIRLMNPSQRELASKRKEFVKIVGEELTSKLYNEINQ